MDSSRIKLGAVAGAIAGMGMGMWMMLYYLAAGLGFWSPLGYIGHFVLRSGNITDPAQVVAGLVIHMMTSMFLGAAIATVFRPTHRLPSALRGMALALGVWVVMQYGVLNILDRVAYEGLVQWAFAVGHGIFGGMLGLIVGTSPEKSARGVAAHPGSLRLHKRKGVEEMREVIAEAIRTRVGKRGWKLEVWHPVDLSQ